MELAIDEARRLIEAAMKAARFSPGEAAIIADHLLDCELRGVTMGGLSRALTVVEHFGHQPARSPLRITRETAVSAAIEGGSNIGYLIGHAATGLAIEKARQSGIGVVSAHCAIFSGMLSYYAERITEAGFVCIATSSVGPMVAPEGGTQAMFGTNPVAMGFPSSDAPVIWDIGTSRIMLAEAVLAGRLGHGIPDDLAFDADGRPTTDPARALEGAFRVWGGHKGSGLATSVQLLGMMAGAPARQDRYGSIGIFIQAIDPALFGDAEEFSRKVAEFAETLRKSRPEHEGRPVRVAFDRSRSLRERHLAQGTIEVDDSLVAALMRKGAHAP